MNRETFRKTRHKSPRFKASRDDELCWEERKELTRHRRKKKHQKNRIETEY